MASRFNSLEDDLALLDPVKAKTISAVSAALKLFGGLYLFVLTYFAK